MNSYCQIIKVSSWEFIAQNHTTEYKYKDGNVGGDKKTLQS